MTTGTRSPRATAKRMGAPPRRAVVHVREFLADSLTPIAVYRRLEKISPVRFLLAARDDDQARDEYLGAVDAYVAVQ